MKAFAEGKSWMAKMRGQAENFLLERRKCWLPALSPFPTKFPKALSFMVLQIRNIMMKDNWFLFSYD